MVIITNKQNSDFNPIDDSFFKKEKSFYNSNCDKIKSVFARFLDLIKNLSINIKIFYNYVKIKSKNGVKFIHNCALSILKKEKENFNNNDKDSQMDSDLEDGFSYVSLKDESSDSEDGFGYSDLNEEFENLDLTWESEDESWSNDFEEEENLIIYSSESESEEEFNELEEEFETFMLESQNKKKTNKDGFLTFLGSTYLN